MPSRRRPGKATRLNGLAALEKRLVWLSSWTIHHANHIRENADGLKVGGHQASCASIASLMTALYFDVLQPRDRVAVKPHASPVLHAIEYLLGRQSRAQLEAFRGFGGAQSYPSRTKDRIRVDFSTGSVGLGVAVTAFSSLVQDMHLARGRMDADDAGRFIALVGDAELDEGNVYEALIEAHKHQVRNCWWIIDYNRQSLDATTPERMFDRFDDIFETLGWRVIPMKYGKKQRALFAKRGGAALREWIDSCPNALYSALTYEGGAAWRKRLTEDLSDRPATVALIDGMDDTSLARVMTELGGHCLETILEAYAKAAASDTPAMILAYTIKGRGMPFQGHKDNHAGLMTPTQIEAVRSAFGIAPGEEFEAFAGLTRKEAKAAETVLSAAPFAAPLAPHRTSSLRAPPLEEFPDPGKKTQSTQAAFGKIMAELAKQETEFSERIVTTSPDVTVSTNLGGFVNRTGLFSRTAKEDVFRQLKIASPQVWAHSETGQHIELGIAENNLFLMLAALGLSDAHFGEPLIPVGTLYDPFIARGLDALNYAAYQDARFIVVATPSGLTLGPEGGAHQSITSPLIGVGQPGLTSWEPTWPDELKIVLHRAMSDVVAEQGGASYLRLSTRTIPERGRDLSESDRTDLLRGGYWLEPPERGAELALIATGALLPEAREAYEALRADIPGLGLLCVVSADLLHRDWTAAQRATLTEAVVQDSHIQTLLSPLSERAGLVTLTDGAPHTLSWMGSVRGHRVAPLGVERFGQTGSLTDLYREYRLDADAIVEAAAILLA